jgi:hypothetical protein
LPNGLIECTLVEKGQQNSLFGESDNRRRLRESANKILPKLARSEQRTVARLLEMELHNSDEEDPVLAADGDADDSERPAYHHRAADAIRAVVMDDSMDTAAKLKRIKILLGIMDDGQDEDDAGAEDVGDAERETAESRQFDIESGLAWLRGGADNPPPRATQLRETRQARPSGSPPKGDVEGMLAFIRA